MLWSLQAVPLNLFLVPVSVFYLHAIKPLTILFSAEGRFPSPVLCTNLGLGFLPMHRSHLRNCNILLSFFVIMITYAPTTWWIENTSQLPTDKAWIDQVERSRERKNSIASASSWTLGAWLEALLPIAWKAHVFHISSLHQILNSVFPSSDALSS